MDIINVLLALFFIFLIGYSIGRKVGIKEGFKKGLDYSPIKIRKEIIESGKCPFCDNDN